MEIERAKPEDLADIGIDTPLFNRRLLITGVPKGAKGEDMEDVIKSYMADLLPEIHKRLRPHFKDVSITWV